MFSSQPMSLFKNKYTHHIISTSWIDGFYVVFFPSDLLISRFSYCGSVAVFVFFVIF